MDHGAEAANLRVRKVSRGRKLERLKWKALRGLAKCEVDILVGDAASRGEAKSAVWGEATLTAEDSGLPEPLRGKIHKVTELQLTGVRIEASPGVIAKALRGEGLLLARRDCGETCKGEGI